MPWQCLWVKAWVAYLLSDWWATATIEDGKAVAEESEPSKYNEIVITKATETIMPSHPTLYMQGWGLLTLERGINVMTQALCAEDGSLPRAWWYRTLIQSCTGAAGMLLWWWEIVQHVPRLFEEEDPSGKSSCSHMGTRAPCADWFDRGVRRSPLSSNAKADCEARAREIVRGVRSDGLESWPPELAASTWSLLADYHDIFSLDPANR